MFPWIYVINISVPVFLFSPPPVVHPCPPTPPLNPPLFSKPPWKWWWKMNGDEALLVSWNATKTKSLYPFLSVLSSGMPEKPFNLHRYDVYYDAPVHFLVKTTGSYYALNVVQSLQNSHSTYLLKFNVIYKLHIYWIFLYLLSMNFGACFGSELSHLSKPPLARSKKFFHILKMHIW